ncbi:MAG: hypothetical protein NZZ41_01330 [Candidatus Dojkabacteria bacterium]|nr:hypothetical protein [Candidatus Dojkabacteria bacterium]
MTRTVYEVYNETTTIQFLTLEEANEYASQHNMLVREVQQEYEEAVITPQPTVIDWIRFEDYLYKNTSILQKGINSTGNGFSFLLKVLTDGKTTGASEQALQLAINMVLSGMNQPLTEEEINYINNKLEECNFTIRI